MATKRLTGSTTKIDHGTIRVEHGYAFWHRLDGTVIGLGKRTMGEAISYVRREVGEILRVR